MAENIPEAVNAWPGRDWIGQETRAYPSAIVYRTIMQPKRIDDGHGYNMAIMLGRFIGIFLTSAGIVIGADPTRVEEICKPTE